MPAARRGPPGGPAHTTTMEDRTMKLRLFAAAAALTAIIAALGGTVYGR